MEDCNGEGGSRSRRWIVIATEDREVWRRRSRGRRDRRRRERRMLKPKPIMMEVADRDGGSRS